jgi:hypothetical protein
MPAKSIAQQHLMQAAEHGADFPMAEKLRQTMTHDQLHDFSVGSEAGKPERVGAAPILGDSAHVMASNQNTFMQKGMNERDALRASLQVAKPKRRGSAHKNLGKFLHPRKDGKPHGSDKF